MKIWLWLVAKFGRIITAVGATLSGVETFDITPIKDPLEQITSHRFVMGVTVLCFALSWWRHHQAAKRT